ncbi:MAG TPA: GrpB family protein [Pyrinomonadaceae bacterium]|jgi:GrpB-like predicted nucleotidyltransferase (UPF0157 family)|nr:GrpB family protein [Pyrinomonadaceae bacterium]
MTLGLQRGTVALSLHREEWHQLFDQEKSRILRAIGEFIIDIEHVGSTTICGIVAKPILDVMVGIPTFEDGEKCVAALDKLGYEYKGENGIPGRHFFGKGAPRTHHLHMVAADSDFWKHHLLFRDYLISNRQVAEEYNNLKIDLAARFPQDREAYTNGKESFVMRVLREAEISK